VLDGDVEVLNSRWVASCIDEVRDKVFVERLRAHEMRTNSRGMHVCAASERDRMTTEHAELSEMLDNSSEVLDRLSDVLTKPKDVLILLRDVLTKPKDVLINLRDMLIKPKFGEINPSEVPVHLSDVRADRFDMRTNPHCRTCRRRSSGRSSTRRAPGGSC
jgi:hypothetical protein